MYVEITWDGTVEQQALRIEKNKRRVDISLTGYEQKVRLVLSEANEEKDEKGYSRVIGWQERPSMVMEWPDAMLRVMLWLDNNSDIKLEWPEPEKPVPQLKVKGK